MSTSARTRPSEWAIDRFGEYVAGELWHRVPMALAAAVRRAMDAHEASQMSTAHAFGGARWPLQYEELLNHLEAVPGAVPIRPPGAFYQLVIVGGHVLLPWHYATDPGSDMRHVRPGPSFGHLARSVLVAFGPAPRWEQPALPSMPDEAHEPETAETNQVLARLGFRPKTLIVGYASNARQGLLRVGWGEAALAPDGGFHWHHYDELPIPPAQVPRPRSGG